MVQSTLPTMVENSFNSTVSLTLTSIVKTRQLHWYKERSIGKSNTSFTAKIINRFVCLLNNRSLPME